MFIFPPTLVYFWRSPFYRSQKNDDDDDDSDEETPGLARILLLRSYYARRAGYAHTMPSSSSTSPLSSVRHTPTHQL